MKYAIKVNEVKKDNGNVKGFATVVFGDSFKITNIAIVENKDKGQLFWCCIIILDTSPSRIYKKIK